MEDLYYATLPEGLSFCGLGQLCFLFIPCFTFRSKIFHLYGGDTIAGEGFQNLGLCSALRAF
jgi:hypothetical protein